MTSDTRVFRRSDPDFPITSAVQNRLVASGRVEGEETPRRPCAVVVPRPTPVAVKPSLHVPDGPAIVLGETERGTLHLDLNQLMAGR